MTTEFTTNEHGRPEQGTTQGRLACAPYGGQTYFDTNLQTLMYRDSEQNEWRPMGMPFFEEAADAPAALKAVKGALMYDAETDSLSWSDGVVWDSLAP